MARFEDVMFAQEHDAEPLLALIDEVGAAEALSQIASDYHMGGHDTRAEESHGTADNVFRADGYVLSWNSHIGYVGLLYDTQHDE